MKAKAPKMGTMKFAAGGKLSDFERAFKNARAAGAEQFTYNGKMYTTELASDKGKTAPKASASSEPVNARAEAAFASMQANRDRQAQAQKAQQDREARQFRPTPGQPYATKEQAAQMVQRSGIDDKPIEQVRPELALLGPEMLGAGAELGVAGSEAAGTAGRYALNRLAQSEAASAGRMAGVDAARVAQEAAAKKAAAVAKAAATRQAAKEVAKQKLLEENEYMTQFAMRRGGAVKRYASGGSVSSASKRGDGCATKGKTKGKFV